MTMTVFASPKYRLPVDVAGSSNGFLSKYKKNESTAPTTAAVPNLKRFLKRANDSCRRKIEIKITSVARFRDQQKVSCLH